MEIKLKDNIFIRSDNMNYILSKKAIVEEGKNKGEEYWQDIGYYSKLPHLLERYKDYIIQNSSLQTYTELTKAYMDIDLTLREITSLTGYKEAK